MEATFSLPYSEYEVAEKLSRFLKPHGYSVYIPTSRQQKGVDLIINKNGTNKIARVQVKGSRTYKGVKNYEHYIWFVNFDKKYKKGDVDFYIFFCIYPQYNRKNSIDSKKHWKTLFLCFKEDEMFEFLKNAKTKKEGKRDSAFGFSFDSPKKIYATRYGKEGKDVSEFLLEKQIDKIKSFF